ncbi:hypothetical protein BDQ12DRAFT_663609 [Crucibulum laeve]|uniref:Uncharacterized protein n=1 Tax=Crucibulum laeve TaxID=68775 RepID=A0A5C3MCG2_9AGAR|nr:hypothetical protein BDQ12DRAFT_663609 [Crucibulum laeve]
MLSHFHRRLLLFVVALALISMNCVLALPLLGVTIEDTRAESLVENDMQCTVTSNADISGIGVRSCFYAQSLIGILAPSFLNARASGNIFRGNLLTSASLTISTFIQRQIGESSLIDEQLTTFLTFLLTISTTFHFRTILQLDLSVGFPLVGQVFLNGIFSFTVWEKMDFDEDITGFPCGEEISFVIFGHSVYVRNSNFAVIGLLAPMLSFSFPFLLAIYYPFKPESPSNSTPEHIKLHNRASWMYAVVPLGVWIYCVVTIEQIIQRNHIQPYANKWTYGQTLTVGLFLSTFCDGILAGAAKWRRKRKGLRNEQVSKDVDANSVETVVVET